MHAHQLTLVWRYICICRNSDVTWLGEIQILLFSPFDFYQFINIFSKISLRELHCFRNKNQFNKYCILFKSCATVKASKKMCLYGSSSSQFAWDEWDIKMDSLDLKFKSCHIRVCWLLSNCLHKVPNYLYFSVYLPYWCPSYSLNSWLLTLWSGMILDYTGSWKAVVCKWAI